MKRLRHYLPNLAVILFAASMLPGCQYQKVCLTGSQGEAHDPLASFNKNIFKFNMGLDRVFAGPIAETYRFVIPPEARDGAHKFFRNLGEPHIIANDLMQGDFKQAKSDSLRFLINSSAGAGGLFDPATTAGYEAYEQNFGVTAGVWGVPEGPYLMLPVVGPTTLSGLPDLPMRQFTSPLSFLPTFLPFLSDTYVRPSISGAKQVDSAAGTRHHMKAIRGAINPYQFVRNGYRQKQFNMMKRNCDEKQGADPLDEIELLNLE